jgi:hypothetical protein
MPNTTHAVSSNTAHDEVYSVQHYVIGLDTDLRQIGVSPVSTTNKIDLHDITEILLKVGLNTL